MSGLHYILPRAQQCTSISQDCPLSKSFYGYAPSLAPNVVMLVLFSATLVAHGIQGTYYRAWGTLIAMGWGCTCEIMGYIGRLMMHKNPFNLDGFLIQIICLTIAPAFFSAAIYLCLSRIVLLFGADVSRLSPKMYAYIFISCDIISLALQGAGGGLASIAAQNNTPLGTGDNVQLAGLAFQVGSLALFGFCAAEYAWRVRRDPAASARARELFAYNRSLNLCFAALGLSYTAIMTRCIYRVIELSNGWGSTLMKDQIDFVALEGAMIVVAVVALNTFYPGKYLHRAVDPSFEQKSTGSSEHSEKGSEGVAPEHMF